jgi:hypothetical protein
MGRFESVLMFGTPIVVAYLLVGIVLAAFLVGSPRHCPAMAFAWIILWPLSAVLFSAVMVACIIGSVVHRWAR